MRGRGHRTLRLLVRNVGAAVKLWREMIAIHIAAALGCGGDVASTADAGASAPEASPEPNPRAQIADPCASVVLHDTDDPRAVVDECNRRPECFFATGVCPVAPPPPLPRLPETACYLRKTCDSNDDCPLDSACKEYWLLDSTKPINGGGCAWAEGPRTLCVRNPKDGGQ